jgi:hypothetical protein
MSIEYPIEVKKISYKEGHPYSERGLTAKCGDIVKVRPCDKKFGGKTFLGIFMGQVALSRGAEWNEEEGELVIDWFMYNPMIFIPEVNEVVWGCGSWWGKIKSEDDLKTITDEDITNVWYVKALSQLEEKSRVES